MFSAIKNGLSDFVDNWKSGAEMIGSKLETAVDSSIENWKTGVDVIESKLDRTSEKVSEDVSEKVSTMKEGFARFSENFKKMLDPDYMLAEGVERAYESMTGKESDLSDELYDSSNRSFDWDFFSDTSDISGPDF